MEFTYSQLFDFSVFEKTILEKIQGNIGNIVFVILLFVVFLVVKSMLQSEMKSNCPYCGIEIVLDKKHHDKICSECGKEFRIRHMRLYKGEDKVDELLYYVTKSLGYLVVLSGVRIREQDLYFEDFVKSQGITRNQLNDVKIIYEGTSNKKSFINFLYRDAIDKLKLYVEEFYSDRHVGEIENIENTILNILFNFAKIDGRINEDEEKFFRYFRKMFHINDARFNMVINNRYSEQKKSEFYGQNTQNASKETRDKYTYNESYNSAQENNEYNTRSREYYKILECDSNVSDEELKKQYKKLMMKYHPDKYASNDLPEEIEKMLNSKMSELNDAYEKIKRERGIN